jgi:nucleotide-binding universal stress UspA family protein
MMNSPRTILVTTDFSHASAVALEYARELARALRARLCILHVVNDPDPGGIDTERFYRGPANLQRFEDAARRDLEKLMTKRDAEELSVRFELRTGQPIAQILRRLNEGSDIDLVVMGRHHRNALTRLMCGSVVESIVRAAPCPVVVVNDDVRRRRSTRQAA